MARVAGTEGQAKRKEHTMSETFIFHEAGVVPGIPGTFAGVRLDIDDEGNVEVSPLGRHAAFEAETNESVYVAEEAAPLILPTQQASEATRPEMEAEDVPAESSPEPLIEEQASEEQPASTETVYHTEPSSLASSSSEEEDEAASTHEEASE